MAKRKQTAPKGAQTAYVYTGPLPAKRRGGVSGDIVATSDFLAKVVALVQSGLLDGLLGLLGIKKRRGAQRGVDMSQIMLLLAKYGPILQMLLPLLEKFLKPTNKPVEDSGGDTPTKPGELPPGADDDEDQPGPSQPQARTPKRLEAKVFWISRKKTPHAAGGGRYLISDSEKAKVVSGSDPLQSGDRVCFDVSPYDQNGKKYEGEKPVELEHEAGGVGELQVQEDNDYTPVLLAPWEGEAGQPGFQGELTYRARGGGLTSNAIRLRVRPWA